MVAVPPLHLHQASQSSVAPEPRSKEPSVYMWWEVGKVHGVVTRVGPTQGTIGGG